MKSKKKKPLHLPLFKIIVCAVLVLQTTAIVVLSGYIYLIKIDLRNVSSVPITRLIGEAAKGLVEPVNIDSQTGNVYVYEARLVLPATNDRSLKLLYNYLPPIEGETEEVRLIDKLSFNGELAKLYARQDITDAFNGVPKLQACARGYLLKFDNQAVEGTEKKFQKQLSDGRTVYVYSEKICSENSEAMTNYLQQINSY